MNLVIGVARAMVNDKVKEQPLVVGDLAPLNPCEKHQNRNMGDKPYRMICGLQKV